MDRFPTDTRGLANGILGFIAIIVVAGVLWTLMNGTMDLLFPILDGQATDQQAQDAIDRREQIWNGLLFFFIVLAGLFLIARSIVESRRPG